MNLLYGDCYEIIPTLPDNSIDLVITDPPYDFCGQVHGGGMFSTLKPQNEIISLAAWRQ